MKQALLVIDYINGIAKDGTCKDYLSSHPEILDNTNKLIAAFREKALPIFFIRLAFDENYTGLPKHAPPRSVMMKQKAFLLGSESTEFIDGLDIQNGDTVLNKKFGNPFLGSGLNEHLIAENIEELVFTGIATNNAIFKGANAAVESDYRVVIVTDACGARTEEDHEVGLRFIAQTGCSHEQLSAEEFLKLV